MIFPVRNRKFLGPTKAPEDFAPMERAYSDATRNRKSRRGTENMTEGQRRKAMRLMYIEIGKFALKVGDTQIERTLLARYEPYTRVEKPKSEGIKAVHLQMCKWYDEVRGEYLEAYREDMAAMEELK